MVDEQERWEGTVGGQEQARTSRPKVRRTSRNGGKVRWVGRGGKEVRRVGWRRRGRDTSRLTPTHLNAHWAVLGAHRRQPAL